MISSIQSGALSPLLQGFGPSRERIQERATSVETTRFDAEGVRGASTNVQLDNGASLVRTATREGDTASLSVTLTAADGSVRTFERQVTLDPESGRPVSGSLDVTRADGQTAHLEFQKVDQDGLPLYQVQGVNFAGESFQRELTRAAEAGAYRPIDATA